MAKRYALTNPPQDVIDAVVALRRACSGWEPTSFTVPDNLPVVMPLPSTLEESVCSFAKSPEDYLWSTIHQFTSSVVAIGIMVAFLVWMLWFAGLLQPIASIGRWAALRVGRYTRNLR